MRLPTNHLIRRGPPFTDIDQIREAAHRNGETWFDRDVMKLHGSIVYPEVYGGYWFVSSERYPSEKTRHYHVRQVNAYGTVLWAGGTVKHSSKHRAIKAAKRAAGVTL